MNNLFSQPLLFMVLYISNSEGALAQLGARNVRNVEATGSNPVCSIYCYKEEHTMVDFNEQSNATSLNDDALSGVSGGTQEEDTISVRCPNCSEKFRVTGYKKSLVCPSCHKTFEMARPTASVDTVGKFDSIMMKC